MSKVYVTAMVAGDRSWFHQTRSYPPRKVRSCMPVPFQAGCAAPAAARPPDPVVLKGPPAPDDFARLAELPADKAERYKGLYDRFMADTRPQRDSLASLRRDMSGGDDPRKSGRWPSSSAGTGGGVIGMVLRQTASPRRDARYGGSDPPAAWWKAG
jgi:hypothetical protein